MLIKKIRLKNFKNFKDAELELGDMNVLVGANASGKSNFLQALKFLKDIQEHGLENAISLQGGMEYLRNVNCNEDETVEIEVEFSLITGFGFRGHFFENDYSMETNETLIGVLNFEKVNFTINLLDEKIEEDLVILGKLIEIPDNECNLIWDKGKNDIDEETLNQSLIKTWNDTIEFSLKNKEGKIKYKEHDVHDNITFKLEEGEYAKLSPRELYPFNNGNSYIISTIDNYYNKSILELDLLPENVFDFSLYDFDLKKIKQPSSIIGKVDLEQDGHNLSLVIKKILSDEKKARQFSNLISDILPFIQSVETEKFYDKSLLFKIQEKGHTSPIPSSLLSDGTVSVTAILIALFFENNRLAIIEEPEYGIHPSLVSKLVDTFYEAAKNKQIIITTHSSEILKHIKLEDLRLISRDENGFSTISKPAEKEMVKEFLKNELGINDLFVQNLLDI